jgi:hypothetical protein
MKTYLNKFWISSLQKRLDRFLYHSIRNSFMISLTAILLTGLLVTTATSSFSQDQLKAMKTNEVIVIDGVANESVWTTATWYTIDQVWTGAVPTASDFTGRYKLTWDQNYLYVLAEITDNILSDDHAAPLTNWWDDDCIEFFIDENRSKGNHQYNYNAFAYHISLTYDVVDIGTDKNPHLFNDHIMTKRTANGNTYTWESRVKIFGDSFVYGGTNTPLTLTGGKIMGFSMAYNDNDAGTTRESMIGSGVVPGTDKNVGYITADYFQQLTLEAEPQILTRITVNCPTAPLNPGETYQFIATGWDQFNNQMAITPAWSVSSGTISSSGLFTAIASGSFAVSAQSGGKTASCTVSVNRLLNVPGKIEAEDFSSSSGVEIFPIPEGGNCVGFLDAGDWLKYAVNVASAGTYNLSLRVASPVTTGKMEIRNQVGTILSTVFINSTGGWQVWTTKTVTVPLTSGPQTLGVYITGAGINFDWMEFATPSKIEAENYVSMAGITTAACDDEGGGLYVKYWGETSWTNYQVTIPETGEYMASFRVGFRDISATIPKLEVQDASSNVLTSFVIPYLNEPWETVYSPNNFTLQAGVQTIRISSPGKLWIMNWFEIKPAEAPVLTRIKLSPSSANIYVGDKKCFALLGYDQYDRPMILPQTQVWSTSCGTLDANHCYTSQAEGTCNITVTLGTFTANAIVTVKAIPKLTTIVLTPQSASIGIGDSTKIYAAGKDQYGYPIAITPPLVWSTNGGSISPSLYFKGTSAGNFTISAQSGSIIGSTTVSVIRKLNIPGKIEAEDFSRAGIIILERGTTFEFKYPDGWAEYDVNVAVAGTYNLSFRVANMYATSNFQLKSGTNILATVSIPNTGGWQTFTTLNFPVTLAQGPQTLRIQPTSGMFVMDWFNTELFYKIEAESYTSMFGVQIQATTDVGGGQNVGYINNNDWMTYPVNIALAGTYSVNFRVAGWANTGIIALQDATFKTLTAANVPNNGGYQKWSTVAGENTFTLAAGNQNLRIFAVSAPWNLNWFELKLVETPVLTSITVTPTPVTLYGMQSQQFIATGKDQFGNAIAIPANPTWTATGGTVSTSGLYTAGKEIGIYEVAIQSGTIIGRAQVSIVESPVPTIEISPNPIMVHPNQSLQFTAVCKDQYGNVIVNPALAWSATGGTVSQTGLYTAGTELGNYTLSAQLGVIVGTAMVTITNVAVGNIIVTPKNLSISAGQTQQFTAKFMNPDGVETDLPAYAVWSATGGTVSPTGLYTAGTSLGNFVVDVVAGISSGFAPLTIVQGPVLTTIEITPPSSTIPVGQSLQLNAAGKDQFGNPIAFTQPIEWIVTPNDGAIIRLGIFSPSKPGIYSVCAKSGDVIGCTTITVVDGLTIPGKIEAEAYTAMQGIQKQPCTDTEGGENIGYVEAGDWLDYNVNVNTARRYNVSFRVASQVATGAFQLKVGATVLATVAVPNTGGWQNWQTVIVPVNLTNGLQTIRILATGSGLNLNWFEFVIAPVPLHIEAESYTSMFGIQTQTTTDIGGGLNVGYSEPGDWMNYTLNVPTAGTYSFNFRVASLVATGKIEIRNAAGATLATLSQGSTGGWQTWITKGVTANLTAGLQTLRIYYTGAGLNINWFEFASTDLKSTEMEPEYGNISESKKLEVYPNPASEIVTIETGSSNFRVVDICTLTGAVLFTQPISSNKTMLDISRLNTGLYLISLRGDNKAITKKLIIK